MIDHLWQSTLFAIAIALLMPLFKRQSAALRFWLWFAASVKFLFPFSLLIWLGSFLPALPERTPFLAAESLVMTPVLIAPSVELMPAVPWLWVVWAAGALFLGVRWLVRWRNLQAALRGAPDLMVDAPVPVKAVASFLEPGLVGILRPVIMMPRGVAEHLSPSEMRAVLAHEAAHLSRRDNLWASIQMLVELLFWFHPLVWWIGTRLVVERERACDEAVLAQGTAPRAYAQGILKICRFHLQPSLSCAAGVSGGNLTARVSAIMTNRGSDNADGARILLLGGLGFATLLLPLLAGAPGSAPVNELARQIASVLQAPPALPQIMAAAPEPPVTRLAPRRTQTRAAALVPPVAAGPQPVIQTAPPVLESASPQGARATVLAASPPAPAETQDDAIACREPQRLSGTRLMGPSVCLKASQWAALHAEGRTMGPDGRTTVAIANYERVRSITPPACHRGVPITPTNPGPACF